MFILLQIPSQVENKRSLAVGESVSIQVHLERELDDDELAAAQKVAAARYPKVDIALAFILHQINCCIYLLNIMYSCSICRTNLRVGGSCWVTRTPISCCRLSVSH